MGLGTKRGRSLLYGCNQVRLNQGSDLMSETLSLPVLPLDDTVVLPTMVVPVEISGAEVRAAIEAARLSASTPGDAKNSDAKPQLLLVPRIGGKYSSVGTLGVVEQTGRLPSGEPAAVIRGLSRVRIGTGTVGPGAALWVEGTVVDEPPVTGRAQELADSAGYAAYLTSEQKNELLETVDPEQRLERLTSWARDALAELDVAETIQNDVREGMEKQQREFLLRQQLAAIRKELSELDGKPGTEEDDYRARIEAANLPEKVEEAALKEADKLERSSDQSPEGSWIRTWLDTVLEIPWNERSDDAYDIAGARAILDADHAGLDEVKDRIIEYLAVRKRRADKGLALVGGRRSGAVLALTGPPGVGKTSLGESVARAMGRKFARVALGGVGRGAGPGAEPHVPRPLPRGRAGPVRRAVHRDRERGRGHTRAADGPDGADPAGWLHRGREGHDRTRPPAAPPARAGRARGQRREPDRRGAAPAGRRVHP